MRHGAERGGPGPFRARLERNGPGLLDDRRTGYLADFANLFAIRPWEWGLLTLSEVELLMKTVDKAREDIKPK